MDHHIFVRKAYILNFRPLVPFLHVKKFVVGVKGDFSVKLRPKLNNKRVQRLQPQLPPHWE